MKGRNKLWAVAALALATPFAAAQDRIQGELSARVVEGEVRVAIELEMDFGWHLYHTDLGHPKAVGEATKVTLAGEGITWGEVTFPEPIPFPQMDYVTNEEHFIFGHEDGIVAYARGRMGEGADVSTVTAHVTGQICDEQGCVQVDIQLEREGEGADATFADFDELDPPAAPEPRPTEDTVEMGEADATVYGRVVDGKLRVAIEIELTPGWHIYSGDIGHPDAVGEPTIVELHGADVEWGPVLWPHPHQVDQSFMGEGVYINAHEDSLVLFVEGTPKPGVELAEDAGDAVWIQIGGQTCKEQCILYLETAVSQGKGPDVVFAKWDERWTEAAEEAAHVGGPDGAVAREHVDAEEEESQSLLGFLLAAIGWGLFTLLMPCTYPMIPITISFFTKQADARGGHVLPLSLAYGAGIVSVFVLIGVVFGAVIIQFAVHPVTNIVIGLLFVYFSLVLFGLLKMEPPRALMNMAGKASMVGGYLGVFLMGVTLVITSFTCTAPFVGSLLSLGAGKTVAQVALGMGVFGATMAIPFVLLSLVPGKIAKMPRSGQWMNTLKFTLGFVELAAALKFLSNSDIAWHWNVISREFFLVAWVVIFVLAGLYLLGILRFGGAKEPVGAKRMTIGALFLAFAAYCGWAIPGNKMDSIMTAMLPPYSGGHLFPELYDTGATWQMVLDDYDEAHRVALEEDKLLLLNFTGHI